MALMTIFHLPNPYDMIKRGISCQALLINPNCRISLADTVFFICRDRLDCGTVRMSVLAECD